MKDIQKILGYIRPFWARVSLNVVFNFFSALFSLFSLTMVIPFLGILFQNQKMVYERLPLTLSVDSIQNNFNFFLSQLIENRGEIHALVAIGFIVIITSLFKNGFKYLALYHLTPVRTGVARNLRNSIYRKSIELPLSYYSKERKGDTISRISNDVHQIEISIISSLEMLFREPLTIFIYLGSLIIMSPGLSLVVFVLLPVSALIIGRIGKSLKGTALKGQKKLGLILSVMEETLGGLRIIKA